MPFFLFKFISLCEHKQSTTHSFNLPAVPFCNYRFVMNTGKLEWNDYIVIEQFVIFFTFVYFLLHIRK